MTVEIAKVKEIYACNGTTTEFAITFPLFATTDLIVGLLDAAGAETVLTKETDYTVTLTTPTTLPSLGHIDLLIAAPVTGNQLALYMDHDYTQEVVITNNGALPVSAMNEANDRAVLLLLQLLDKMKRSLTLPRKSSKADLTLPEPVAASYLRWKADLSGLENVDLTTLGVEAVTDLARILLAESTTDGILDNFGVFEKRKTTTWTASDAAQTIGGTGVKIIPVGGVIESMTGKITGTPAEIKVGNADDDDYWVSETSGLAVGKTFGLNFQTPDGDKREMIVKPSSAMTCTIEWAIRGYVV